MDNIAHILTKTSLWAIPVLWLALAWAAWTRHSWTVGACLLLAGITGLLWNVFFLPVVGERPAEGSDVIGVEG